MGALDRDQCLPSVDVIQNLICTLLSFCNLEIVADPVYEMVFECALDYLMEKIRREHLMYIRSGEEMRERLQTFKPSLVLLAAKHKPICLRQSQS